MSPLVLAYADPHVGVCVSMCVHVCMCSHSVYDSFTWFDTWGDPTFEWSAMSAKVLGTLAVNLASDLVRAHAWFCAVCVCVCVCAMAWGKRARAFLLACVSPSPGFASSPNPLMPCSMCR